MVIQWNNTKKAEDSDMIRRKKRIQVECLKVF